MTRLAAFLVAAVCVARPAAAVQGLPSDSAIRRRVDSLVAPQAAAGMFSGVVLIASGTHVILERGYGFSDWQRHAPLTPAARLGIGSINKVMTQIIVADLVREGKLDLQAPVERYLKGFPRGPAGGIPTVGHLLLHQAGVPHRVTTDADEARAIPAAEMVLRVDSAGLSFEPGTRTSYSSAGYTCLARIVELVERAPFARVLEDRVFRPAGMSRASDETSDARMPDRAVAHRLGVDAGRVVVMRAPQRNLMFLTGAGSAYTTAADLWHFIDSMRAGKFGAPFTDSLRSVPGQWHGWYGRAGSYEASVDFLPEKDLTFVLLTNLQSGATWQLRQAVRTLVMGGTPAAVQPLPAVAQSFEPSAQIDGRYGDSLAPVRVRTQGNHLFRDDNEFYPTAEHRYVVPASGSRMYFARDSSGAVRALVTISGSGRESTLPRLDASPP